MQINLEEEIKKILEKEWEFLPTLPDNSIEIEDGDLPGVYLIARVNNNNINNIHGRKVKDSLEEIFYVGMSNSLKGVVGRLNQFKHAIEIGKGHSGGNRFFKDDKFCKGTPFSKFRVGQNEKFYVASLTFPCTVDKKLREAKDLQTMGGICCLEYYLLAFIKDKTKKEPELNKK